MKNYTLSILPLLLVITLFQSSCKSYLLPAALGTNMSYQPKPMVIDSNHSLTHASGGIALSVSPGKSVRYSAGMININRAHTYKSINFAYGLMGYYGSASYDELSYDSIPRNKQLVPSFKMSTGGVGFKTSVGYHFTSQKGNTDFRIINWENSFSKELGNYAKFRKEIYRNAAQYYKNGVSDLINIWTTGLSTEIIWSNKNDPETKHAFRYFVGYTYGLKDSFLESADKSFFELDTEIIDQAITINYFHQYKKFSMNFELGVNNKVGTKITMGYVL